jgi:hypothetical protein
LPRAWRGQRCRWWAQAIKKRCAVWWRSTTQAASA